MKFAAVCLIATASSASAFAPSACGVRSTVAVQGYLDDLTNELKQETPETSPEDETHEATKMADEDKDRYGPGNWEGFVGKSFLVKSGKMVPIPT